MLISIIVFSCMDFILPVQNKWNRKNNNKVVLRVILMPLIAGISYKIQRYSSNHLDKIWVRALAFRSYLYKRITTKEPDLSQLEVAIAAIKVKAL